MREIPLTRGYVALVDDDDYEWLSQWKWCALVRKTTSTVYAKRVEHVDGKPKTIYMHRMIVGAADDQLVDHIDRDGLNNQRANLRIATHHQNMMNMKVNKRNRSGYRGVSWDNTRQKWSAHMSHNGRLRKLGRFDSPEDAARAYDSAVRSLRGDFATLNFPEEVAS